MRLTARLGIFFLAGLALVLLSFSAALFLAGRSYLQGGMDRRLGHVLDTLEASIDVETGGLEWEPEDRRIPVGYEAGDDQVRWVLQDAAGRLIDRSRNAVGVPEFPPPAAWEALPALPGDGTSYASLPDWRLARRHLRLAELLLMGRGHSDDDGPDDDPEYDHLVLTVGLSPQPMAASLRWLATCLVLGSSGLWLLCALVGWWLARRGLRPVVRMAESARLLARTESTGQLPSPGTHDELEDLASAFNQLLDRRQQLLERQQRFTGDASHQLRTPLAGLLGTIEVIRRRPRQPAEYEEALDQIHREAGRLQQIVESLLFLARTETETQASAGQIIDLSTWLPSLAPQWEHHPRVADLDWQPLPVPVWVRANPALLAQAVGNLVDNGLKYSEPGTLVSIGCLRAPGQSIITVQDHGMGISRDEQAAIFEPFYRSPRARHQGRPGTGLGLSVVQRIVRAFQGEIHVESQPGHGTKFVLAFPDAACNPMTNGQTDSGFGPPMPVRAASE